MTAEKRKASEQTAFYANGACRELRAVWGEARQSFRYFSRSSERLSGFSFVDLIFVLILFLFLFLFSISIQTSFPNLPTSPAPIGD